MRWLSAKEQDVFRKEFLEKEREVQRNIGVYLSGLVLVTGWIVGPQSRPLIAMILGNDGYNVYAILLLIVLNLIFTTFLIYKSLFIHEITQFSAVMSEPGSGFTYWESWRRSSQSATAPVRAIYTIALAVLPIVISGVLLFVVGRLLYADPQDLAAKLASIESFKNAPPAEQLGSVFAKARYMYWFVVLLHSVPFYFFYQNIGPVLRKWNEIAALRFTEDFQSLDHLGRTAASATYTLSNKETGEILGTINEEQLRFLQEQLEEESEADSDYYLTKETLELLRDRTSDAELSAMLEHALKGKKEIEIEWKQIYFDVVKVSKL